MEGLKWACSQQCWGHLPPRYRTLSDWAAQYSVEQAALPLKSKTIAARELEITRILKLLGPETRIGAVRPSHIAQAQRSLYAHSPCMAAHWLVEVRRYFDAAVVEGWIDSNPASPVRALPAPVSRARLSLDKWRAVYGYARHHQVAWVQHMLVLALVSGQRRADLQKMRFADVRDQHLFVVQQKTGARIALPLALRLDAIDVSLGEAIEACRDYAPPGEPLHCGASLSTRFAMRIAERTVAGSGLDHRRACMSAVRYLSDCTENRASIPARCWDTPGRP